MWSDREAERDLLGYNAYVAVLAEVCITPDLAPLTLGIFGSWGSGKTSLMRMLQSNLGTSAPGGTTTTETLWFNAWKYEGREEAQAALIHAILNKLEARQGLGNDIKDAIKKLKDSASILKLGKFLTTTVLSMKPDIGEFIDCFSEESDKLADSMEGFDSRFDQLIARLGLERIVVFIDDLDRCSSAKVVETFETIKLFLNTPRCTFVIGADAAKIQQAVGEVFGVTDTTRQRDFLEKIVQLPFNIPEQRLADIQCYVGMLLLERVTHADHRNHVAASHAQLYASPPGDPVKFLSWIEENAARLHVPKEQARSLVQEVLPYVGVLARGLRGNPRQVKRFLNILEVRRRLAARNGLEIDSGMLLKLGVLEYADPAFYSAIVETTDPASGSSELVATLTAGSSAGSDGDSQLAKDVRAVPWRMNFLSEVPALSASTDLRPYLFLAQTSLDRGRGEALQPMGDETQALVTRIASTDPLRSRAAARRVAGSDAALAAAVTHSLLSFLSSQSDAAITTHILSAATTICSSHAGLFPQVLAALNAMDLTGRDAVALAAASLVAAAERARSEVPAGLKDRIAKASPLASALTRPARRGSN